jgi:NADP-dependent 3-hydroxy acid dehydrogenase YdfG
MASTQSTSPVWFITGCSTGFGRELAAQVAAAGGRVCATARSPESLADLAAAHPDTVLALKLDVTRQADIDAAVTAATARFGQIDILVNNAGYGYVATVEDGDDAEIRQMFETNVFGLFAMCRAVIPQMRARRSGHIINISSIAGLNGNPATGYYAATKHAVEGLSDAMVHELTPFGIRISCIELKQTPVALADYTSSREREAALKASSGRQAGDPVKAAAAIRAIALKPDSPRHLLLGRKALETARDKIARLASDIDRFETVTLDADFPAGQ